MVGLYPSAVPDKQMKTRKMDWACIENETRTALYVRINIWAPEEKSKRARRGVVRGKPGEEPGAYAAFLVGRAL